MPESATQNRQPGLEQAMQPKPESRDGKRALITGGDSGSAGPWRSLSPVKALMSPSTPAMSTKTRTRLVNAVAPGPVWTPLIPASFDEEKIRQLGENTALGRAGKPAEIAPT